MLLFIPHFRAACTANLINQKAISREIFSYIITHQPIYRERYCFCCGCGKDRESSNAAKFINSSTEMFFTRNQIVCRASEGKFSISLHIFSREIISNFSCSHMELLHSTVCVCVLSFIHSKSYTHEYVGVCFFGVCDAFATYAN